MLITMTVTPNKLEWDRRELDYDNHMGAYNKVQYIMIDNKEILINEIKSWGKWDNDKIFDDSKSFDDMLIEYLHHYSLAENFEVDWELLTVKDVKIDHSVKVSFESNRRYWRIFVNGV